MSGTEWVGKVNGSHWTKVNGRDQAVLPYGTTLLLPHGLVCTSAESGMTCTNHQRHSFTVSRQTYHVQ